MKTNAATVLVLYEDSPGALPVAFGPHRFVLQCLADRLGLPWWELGGLVLGQPKKGNSQLRRACREARLYDLNRVVIAVYDDDRIRTMLGVAADACIQQVTGALRKEAVRPERLRVVLLERNIDDVVRAVQACRAAEGVQHRKPTPDERDLILKDAATPANRHVRECVLQRVPSLAYLVDKLAATLRG